MPTVIEPLRDEWDAVRAAAVTARQRRADRQGAATEVAGLPRAAVRDARARPRLRHRQLPLRHAGAHEAAGGRGARRAARARATSRLRWSWTGTPSTRTSSSGIEINPRAAAIAELVLWIGYLQWHFRTRGRRQPARADHQELQEHRVPRRRARLGPRPSRCCDEHGKPVTRWDGRTTKPHPVTGEEVPDETARVPVCTLHEPDEGRVAGGGLHRRESAVHRQQADATGSGRRLRRGASGRLRRRARVGRLRHVLVAPGGRARPDRERCSGSASSRPTASRRPSIDGSSNAILRATRSDFASSSRFLTTRGSISADGAAVRIAMTVGGRRQVHGTLAACARARDRWEAADRQCSFSVQTGQIHADLTIGCELDRMPLRLQANRG